jgi:hypothetical protein
MLPVVARRLLMTGVLAAVAAPLDGQEARRERRPWLSRVRLTPTVATDHRDVRSTAGFGLQLGAEWSEDESRVAVPLAFDLAGDDRRQLDCVTSCAQGRMSAWLLTTGLTLRPAPGWPVRPYVETLVSGGLVQWSNAVAPAGLGAGVAVGGRTGGGFTTRASLGAGLEWRREDRWFLLGMQQGVVHEARWGAARVVRTIVLGARGRF